LALYYGKRKYGGDDEVQSEDEDGDADMEEGVFDPFTT
jgi:hypothetical protein